MASLGSIEHILKTTFKDVYEESEKRINALKARELVKLRLIREEERKMAEAERLKAEAEEAAKKSKDKKGSQLKKDSSKSKSQPAVVVPPSSAPDTSIDDEAEAKFIETYKDYHYNLEHLELEEYLREQMQKGLVDIENDLANKKHQASELLKYLNEQRTIAKQEEEEEEENLKKQGIIVGQHVPALKSHLLIDRDRMKSFGKISNNLIIGSDLMEQNHIDMLRRSGNLPITELMEQRMVSRSIRKTQALSRRTSKLEFNLDSLKKT
jgi:hypothetical protein